MEDQHLEATLKNLINEDPDGFTSALAEVLAADPELHVMDADVPFPLTVDTFTEAGVLTYNRGLVLTLSDGAEFQLTIVRSA